MNRTLVPLYSLGRLFLRDLAVPAVVIFMTASWSILIAWGAPADGPPGSAAAKPESGTPGQPVSVKELDLSDGEDSASAAQTRGPEVVATGVGTDPRSATQNAVLNAVEQVVGILVDAETIVNNDQIVRDQVLTYSRGFVENFKEIDRWQKDGLHYVRIRALVSATRLGEKLKAQNVSLRPIEGDKIAIRIGIEELNEEQAKQMFRRAVADIAPDKLLTVTLVDGDPVVERGPDGVKLTVSYRLAANLDAWKPIYANLQPLLERLSPSKRTGAYLEGQGFVLSGAQPTGDLLYVFKELGAGGVTTDWEEYPLPPWLAPDAQAVADRNAVRNVGWDQWAGYAVSIALLDDQGRVVAKIDRFFPRQGYAVSCATLGHYLVFPGQRWNSANHWYSIGPMLFDGSGFRQAVDLSETFILDKEKLARVKKCAASIENRVP